MKETWKKLALIGLVAIIAIFGMLACDDGGGGGGNGSNTVATPTASPQGGTYTSAQTVTLSCTTEDASIYYTIDGSTPTINSTLYSSAITISGTENQKTTTTLKAIAVKEDMDDSGILTAAYTINLDPNMTYTTIADIDAYLATLPANTADNPEYLPVQIDLSSLSSLLYAINTAGKYVTLDLSACTMSGTEFDPASATTGKDKIVAITLPDTATSIKGGYSFRTFSSLKSFSGAGLTSIGSSAFRDCTSLESVTLPASLTQISEYAFYGCTSLESVTLPEGLTSIGNGAFRYCTSLESISLPEGLTTIAADAFMDCTSLESVTMPANLTTINPSAFSRCTSLVFTLTGSGSLSVIENGKVLVRNDTTLVAYPSASGSVTIPSEITTIGQVAFYGCTSLESIILPEGLTFIDAGAFRYCTSLESVTLPESLTTIDFNAFEHCSNLQTVMVMRSETPLTTLSSSAFTDTHADLQIKVPAGVVDAYKAASGWSRYADRIVSQ